jgi:predicted nuclease of predicted toxin-antitoxin system
LFHLLADENFNADIVRGLLRRTTNALILRSQEIGLEGLSDPDLLAWAAERHLILLTHDRNTMTDFAHRRVKSGQAMPGVILVDDQLPVGLAIDQLLLIIECSEPTEWSNQVLFVPL